MASNVESLIRAGVAALKAGRKAEAEDFLMQAVELDERSEDAWLWLSAAVETLENQQVCLENVLAINPENRRARQGLDMVQEQMQSQAAERGELPVGEVSDDQPLWDSTDHQPEQSADTPSAPAADFTAPAYYGSGQDIAAPSASQYDDWVTGLNLGGDEAELQVQDDFGLGDEPFRQSNVFVSDSEDGSDFLYGGFDELGKPDGGADAQIDPYAIPQARVFDTAPDDDLVGGIDVDDFDAAVDNLYDEGEFSSASPFAVASEQSTDYKSEERLLAYLDYIPAEIKPTHLPGAKPLIPRSTLVGLGVVILGIIAGLAVMASLLIG